MIADFDVTEQMLRHFIQKVHQNRWAHPRVVVCVPSGVTGVEKRAVEEACLSAGARQAYLIEEPMAAAIGAGLPVGEPTGNIVVDIGGGTSEVAVISLGGIVVSQSIRVGGDEIDEAIVNYVKREYKLMIGQQTAEEIKLEIGSAFPLEEEVQAEVRGRDLVSGLPKTVVLTTEEVRDGARGAAPGDHRRRQGDARPHAAGAGVGHHGPRDHAGRRRRAAAGPRRAAARRDPDARHLAESPLTCVAVGSGRSLEEFEAIHRSNKNSRQPAAVDPPRERPAACSPRRWSAAGRAVLAVLVGLSIALLTAYFGESVRRRSTRSSAASWRRSRRSRRAPAARSSPPATWSAGSATRSTPRPRTRSCKTEVERLRGQLARAQTAERDAEQLRALVGLNRADGLPARHRPVAARVIARSPTVWYSTITIDKGSSDGVRVEPAGHHGRRPRRQGRRSVTGGTARGHADHRPLERRLRPGRAERRQRPREAEVGNPNDLILDFVQKGSDA